MSDGIALGRTIYYGSKKSKIFLRIYDKHLEQLKKQRKKAIISKSDDPEMLKEQSEWTRMEIVFREDRAQLAAAYLLGSDNIGKLMRGVLKQYIRFLKRPKNANEELKRRWETAAWWTKILGEVEKIKLTIKPAEKTIEHMKTWIDKQISPTLAAIFRADEGEMTWLIEVISNGSARLKTKHMQAIHQYLAACAG